jgi:hypothetical protein
MPRSRRVTSIDPGTTHLAICQVDMDTKQPVYLMLSDLKRPHELAKWRRRHDAFVKRAKWVAENAPVASTPMKRRLVSKKWRAQLAMLNKNGQPLIRHYRHSTGNKKLKKALTEEERLDAIHRLITQNPALFAQASHVLVEKQMKRSHTITTTIFRAMLHGKSSTVNPESMKRHFGISKRDRDNRRQQQHDSGDKTSYKTGKDSASLRVMIDYFDKHHFVVWFETLIRTCIAHHKAHMTRYAEYIGACRAVYASVAPKKATGDMTAAEKQWHAWFNRATKHYDATQCQFAAWQADNIDCDGFTSAFEDQLAEWWRALRGYPDWKSAEQFLRKLVPFMVHYLNKWDDLLDAYLQAIYYIETTTTTT